MSIVLSSEELVALTGYEQPAKQLHVLKSRGFFRAFIARKGGVVVERAHYESITRGKDIPGGKSLAANVSFMQKQRA